jgi:hypothetical protein
MSFLF